MSYMLNTYRSSEYIPSCLSAEEPDNDAKLVKAAYLSAAARQQRRRLGYERQKWGDEADSHARGNADCESGWVVSEFQRPRPTLAPSKCQCRPMWRHAHQHYPKYIEVSCPQNSSFYSLPLYEPCARQTTGQPSHGKGRRN
jgi:hypothetical protein